MLNWLRKNIDFGNLIFRLKIKEDGSHFVLFSDCILIYWLYYGTVQYWTVQKQWKITLITINFWVGKWNFQSQLFFLNKLSRFLQVFHSGLCQLWWFLHGSAKHYHFCLVFSIFPSDSRYLGKPYCNQPVSSRTDFSWFSAKCRDVQQLFSRFFSQNIFLTLN